MEASVDGVRGSKRPHRNLLKYYALSSLPLGPLLLLRLIPKFLRYRTLRYRFDDEGVSMAWGALFHREVSLKYGRIQDIHLTSNFVERWLGLARVQVQTAAGSSSAEMTIEGLPDYQSIRDFLYVRMRDARSIGSAGHTKKSDASTRQVVEALRATAVELRALRQALAAQRRETGR